MTTSSESNPYQPTEIEAKWQKRWDKDELYRADIDPSRRKFYALTMLPYPSGDLHIGHWYAMAPSDVRARYMRMKGYNVMFPIGFDAFGLPAENAAIKHQVHPKEWTYKNIERMRGQLRRMGAMFDWRREAVSADPEYYRWTQWFFLQLLHNDLAYRKKSPVDWCPGCNTTLAREQVWGDDRHCERCGHLVDKRDLVQWFFRTTSYADELLDYSSIDWPEQVQTKQRNWIGRTEGAEVTFRTEAGSPLDVFTTRPDTLWGATFMVLAPEHPLVAEVTTDAQRSAVEAYVAEARRFTDMQREKTDRDKTGVFTGGYAINPVNDERIPIWVADYVLMGYGTGAIMAVPAHDGRDFDFARTFGIDIRVVALPDGSPPLDATTMTEPVTAAGTMVNSGPLTGTSSEQAKPRAIAHLEELGVGKGTVNYRLRDWLISRQRYWGAPIPIILCDACGPVPVPESELPVLLPDDVEWKPTGESPLKLHPTWKNAVCPKCGADAERETDTMDTFMCSSWYHLRYLSPHYAEGPFDPKEYDYWMPIDTYTGGIEHATMHLIYTRFFHKACTDAGITKGTEPMASLRNQGIILGEDSEKMSKSRGNVVAPDVLVDRYGADTVRAYLMFFSRWDQGGPWNSNGIEGTSRWLRRVWRLVTEPPAAGEASGEVVTQLRRKVHQTLQRVTRDLDKFEFNTVVSALMELSNEMQTAARHGAGSSEAWQEACEIYALMLAPVTPHVAEELWEKLGKPYSVHQQAWPEVDEAATAEAKITLIVQVNGKLRDRLEVDAEISKAEAERVALASAVIQDALEGREPKKVIVVPGRLVNVVV